MWQDSSLRAKKQQMLCLQGKAASGCLSWLAVRSAESAAASPIPPPDTSSLLTIIYFLSWYSETNLRHLFFFNSVSFYALFRAGVSHLAGQHWLSTPHFLDSPRAVTDKHENKATIQIGTEQLLWAVTWLAVGMPLFFGDFPEKTLPCFSFNKRHWDVEEVTFISICLLHILATSFRHLMTFVEFFFSSF